MVHAEGEERATDRISEADGFVLLPDPEETGRRGTGSGSHPEYVSPG